jgi:hypothetical protein
MPEHFEDGLRFEDFEDLEVAGFSGRQAQTTDIGAAIALQNGRNAIIRDCKAPIQTGTFLKQSGLTGSLLFMNNDIGQAQRLFQPNQGEFNRSGNLAKN